MMPRPPRPSSQLLREEGDLKRRQLWRERQLRRALAALAAAAAVLLSRERERPVSSPAPPPPPSASSAPLSSSLAAASAAEHRRSSPLPPSFGEGAEGYFPRGCVWRTSRRERAGKGSSSGSSDGKGSVFSPSTPSLEFYLEETRSWTLSMPAACTIAGDPKARGGGEEQGPKKVKSRRRKRTRTKAATAAETAPFPFPLSSTSQSCDALACTYRGGLWLSGRGRWHSVIEGGAGSGSGAAVAGKISRNLRLAPLRVSGPAGAFASAVAAERSSSLRLAAGRTLVVDFGFYRHPSAIGHWAEVAGQLASHVFSETRGSENENENENENEIDVDDENGDENGGKRERKPLRHRFDRVVLLHVSRAHFGEWARAALAAALGVEPGGSLPPVFFQEGVEALSDLRPPPPPPPAAEASSPSPPPPAPSRPPPTIEQREAPMRARLESLSPGDWVVFEEAVIVRDASTGGPRFAAPAAAARAWRRQFFALHGLPVPEEEQQQQQQPHASPQRSAPKTILYLRKSEDRRVLNEAALLEALRSGPPGARVVAADFSRAAGPRSSPAPRSPPPPPSPVPVREQLLLLSTADVLLSAHTSALAGALFLRQRRRHGTGPGGGGGRGGGGGGREGAAAAVVELIQSNWGAWGSLDESFRALTSAFDGDGDGDGDGGDGGGGGGGGGAKALRHGSWRATRRRHGAYPNRRDGTRFGGWGGGRSGGRGRGSGGGEGPPCASEACVEAHTRVDLVVDVPGVAKLVGRALEGGGEVGWGVESSGSGSSGSGSSGSGSSSGGGDE